MSGNREEHRFYPTEILSSAKLNSAVDSAVEAAVFRMIDEIMNNGTRRGFINPVEVTPAALLQMGVDIGAFAGYDATGRHIRSASQITGFDCSVDHNGASTIPSSGHRYVSLFAIFDWDNSDLVIVDSLSYPRLRTESYYIWAYAGDAVPLTVTPIPPANPGNAIRICNVMIREGQTSIAASDVETASPFHQDILGTCIMSSGGNFTHSPRGPGSGRLFEVKTGQTQFASRSVRLVDDPQWGTFFKHYIPTWLSGKSAAAAYLNHGFTGRRHAFIHKKINFKDEGHTYAANFIDLSDITSQVSVLGSDVEAGALYTFHVHDGAQNYTGQTGLLVLGTEDFTLSMIGTYVVWAAFCLIA